MGRKTAPAGSMGTYSGNKPNKMPNPKACGTLKGSGGADLGKWTVGTGKGK